MLVSKFLPNVHSRQRAGGMCALLIALSFLNTCAAQSAPANPQVTEQSVADSRTAGAAAIKVATDFHWIAAPTEDLATPGARTVRLPRCPPGVLGNEPEYWIYISGAGEPEAAKVTGGSCQGDGQPGTLTFTTTRPHPAGYRISSASSGLQEASVAARWANQIAPNYRDGGKVVAPPGEFKIFAPVSFLTGNQTIRIQRIHV